MESETKTNNGAESGSSPSPCSHPQEYVPFGDEWRKEVMKLRKADLVEMLRDALVDRQSGDSAKRGLVLLYNSGSLSENPSKTRHQWEIIRRVRDYARSLANDRSNSADLSA